MVGGGNTWKKTGHESKYPLLGQNGPKFSTAFSSWQDCLTKPSQDVASRPWQWCRPKRDQEKVENRSRLPQKGSRYPGGGEFIWLFNPSTLLQLQPEGSFERQIVEGSKKSLTDLTAFFNTITQQLWPTLRDENKFLKRLLICFQFISVLSSCL